MYGMGDDMRELYGRDDIAVEALKNIEQLLANAADLSDKDKTVAALKAYATAIGALRAMGE